MARHHAHARLLADISWKEYLFALLAVLPLCLADGILSEAQVRPIVAYTLDQIPPGDPLFGLPVDELFPALSRTGEIDALYAELPLLAESAALDPLQESRYQECLARLRELQEIEAREMTAFAEARRQLPSGAFAAEMLRVRALLGEA